MLVLTRKKNEVLHIGQGISIKVIRVSGNKVRLGITAPRDLQVKRTELPDEPQAEVDIEVDEADTVLGRLISRLEDREEK